MNRSIGYTSLDQIKMLLIIGEDMEIVNLAPN